MARTGKQWIPLDVNHADELVHLSPLARYADLCLMSLAKRLMSDGRLNEAQVQHEIAYRIGGDVAPILAELRADDLWAEIDGVLTRRNWAKWNDTAAEIETMAKGGVEGNHLRWHVKRGLTNPSCPLCASGDIGGDSGGDSGTDRGTESQDTDTDGDGDGDGDRSVADRLPVVPAVPRSPRKSRAPERFEITDSMRGWAQKQSYLAGVNLEDETEHFLDHHRSKGSLFVDWSTAWMTWMRRRQQFAPQHANGKSKSMQAIDEALGAIK